MFIATLNLLQFSAELLNYNFCLEESIAISNTIGENSLSRGKNQR